MKTFLMILVGFAGLFGMARGGDPQRSNMFMRWRVLLQGAALALVALLMLLSQG